MEGGGVKIQGFALACLEIRERLLYIPKTVMFFLDFLHVGQHGPLVRFV